MPTWRLALLKSVLTDTHILLPLALVASGEMQIIQRLPNIFGPTVVPFRPARPWLYSNETHQPHAMNMMKLGCRQVILTATFAVFAAVCGIAQDAVTPSPAESKPPPRPDPWKPVKAFIGKWEGYVSGEAGPKKAEREYTFVPKDRFIRLSNLRALTRRRRRTRRA